MGFWDKNRSSYLGQITKPGDSKKKKKKKKKRTSWIVDFVVLAELKVKLKESVKRDKHLDFARERKKKLWNMLVTMKPFVIDMHRTISKELVKGLEDLEIRGQVKTIQTTALLRSVKILRRVQKICCHSNCSEKPPVNASMKKSHKGRTMFLLWENRSREWLNNSKKMSFSMKNSLVKSTARRVCQQVKAKKQRKSSLKM